MGKDTRNKQGKRRKRNKNKGLFLVVFFTIMGFLFIAFGSMMLLFNVEEVVVEGNIHYTKEEIEKKVLTDYVSENTILASLFKRNEKIEGLRFVDSVQINFVNQNKICIVVNEKDVVGYIEDGEKCYYFNYDGLIEEVTKGPVLTVEERERIEANKNNQSAGAENQDGITAYIEETPLKHFVPLVKGLNYTIEETEDGSKLVVDNFTIFNTLASLKKMLNKDSLPPEYVFVDKDYNISLFYEDIEVRLGKDVDLENKVATLAAIMPKIENMSGTLILENYSTTQNGVIFQRKDVEVAE